MYSRGKDKRVLLTMNVIRFPDNGAAVDSVDYGAVGMPSIMVP